MAKKTAFEKWSEEFKESLPENLKNSWTALVDNDYPNKAQLIQKFDEGLMQSDYTVKAQQVAEARKQLEADAAALQNKEAAYANWYQTANTEFTKLQSEKLALESALKATGYVRNDPNNSVTPPTQKQDDMVQKLDALSQRIQAIDQGTFNATAALANLTYKAHRENLPFDSTAILKIASDKRIPIDMAFEEFVKPQREERFKADREKELAEAREAGRREAMSQRATPGDLGNGVSAPVLDRLMNRTEPLKSLPSEHEIVNRALSNALKDWPADLVR